MKQSSQVLKWGILVLFFISGAPALLYQIIWQHHLYTIYGAHAESVAIIVGAFMFGLGIGSLIGGEVSARWKSSPFYLFAIIESLIGLFGYFSLTFFDEIGRMTTHLGVFEAGMIVFLLVLLPTIGMGATLPILANALIKRIKNVGVSVGNLYFVNTLGSACAAMSSLYILTSGWGQHGVIYTAVALNLFVVISALLMSFFARDPKSDDFESESANNTTQQNILTKEVLYGAALLSFFSGFIALSAEIVWLRVMFLFVNGRAFIFPSALGFFLFGIAFGSLYAARLIRKFNNEPDLTIKLITAMIVFSSGIAISLAFMSAGFLVSIGGGMFLFLITTLLALPLGALFPFLMHRGVLPDQNAGKMISRIYAANILGSTIGSVGTGFILLDHVSLRGIVFLLSSLSILLTLFLLHRMQKPLTVAAILAGVLLMCFGYQYNATLYERLQLSIQYDSTFKFEHVVENKSGVVAVSKDRVVYGTGVYDGRFNTDLANDTNIIIRPYSLSAFNPAPKRILIIGLSSGSWAQVLSNMPSKPDVDILEINPGYLKLIPLYKNVASLMTNKRVHIKIEDGRRYLVRNPEEKYDAIVMNTSYYWRSGATNLLSTEFLELLRAHMNKNGVLIYNTTSSEIVYKTGLSTFPYGWRIANALALSDSPMPIDRDSLLSVLASYSIDGKLVLDPSSASTTETLVRINKEFDPAQKFSSTTLLEDREHLLSRLPTETPILTDDNMLIEWQKQK